MKYLLLLSFMPCMLFGQEDSPEYWLGRLIEITKNEIFLNQGNHYSRNYLQGKLDAYEHAYWLVTEYGYDLSNLGASSTN